MKNVKRVVSIVLFVGMACIGMNTYATNIPANSPTSQVEKPVSTKDSHTAAVPVTSPKTEEKNYVRITQPSLKDEIQTFDSQINIMGEATVGTEINIIVYYGEEVESYLSDTVVKDEYKLKTVGATQTFSQLIDLKEGQNNIILQYQYSSNGAKGTLSIKIIRKPESEKKLIKSYIKPEAIVEKIVPPATVEKSPTTQNTAPAKK